MKEYNIAYIPIPAVGIDGIVNSLYFKGYRFESTSVDLSEAKFILVSFFTGAYIYVIDPILEGYIIQPSYTLGIPDAPEPKWEPGYYWVIVNAGESPVIAKYFDGKFHIGHYDGGLKLKGHVIHRVFDTPVLPPKD